MVVAGGAARIISAETRTCHKVHSQMNWHLNITDIIS